MPFIGQIHGSLQKRNDERRRYASRIPAPSEVLSETLQTCDIFTSTPIFLPLPEHTRLFEASKEKEISAN
jgi:hypothetical protein